MVIAASAAFALEHWGASEFAAPDDEGVFEHAALLEVGEERPGGAVGEAAADAHVFFKSAVVIPAAVVELDKAHPAFGEAAGEEAV